MLGRFSGRPRSAHRFGARGFQIVGRVGLQTDLLGVHLSARPFDLHGALSLHAVLQLGDLLAVWAAHADFERDAQVSPLGDEYVALAVEPARAVLHGDRGRRTAELTQERTDLKRRRGLGGGCDEKREKGGGCDHHGGVL